MKEIKIKHIGINTNTEEEAFKTAKMFADLLGLSVKNEKLSVFSGTVIEVMKKDGRGTYGHIGLQVTSVEETMKELGARGVSFDMDSVQLNDGGKIKVIYLSGEYAGFAIHSYIVVNGKEEGTCGKKSYKK